RLRNHRLNSLSALQELRIAPSRSISPSAAVSAREAASAEAAETFNSNEVPRTFSLWKVRTRSRPTVGAPMSSREAETATLRKANVFMSLSDSAGAAGGAKVYAGLRPRGPRHGNH